MPELTATTIPRALPRPLPVGSADVATEGTAALAPGIPDRRPPLRVLRGGPTVGADDTIPPPPVRLLLRGLLEVLSGWRPAAQVALRVSPEIAADLLARPRRRSAAPPPQVLRMRVLRVADDAVETCVVLRRGRRCGALAMRLEFGSRGWLVTRLQVG